MVTRWQIARLLVIESVGLALVASAIVMVAVRWFFPHLLVLIAGGGEAENYPAALDVRTLGCIVLLTVLASVAVALVPVWRLLRSEINPGLKDGGAAGESRGTARMRAALVIAQAALAVVLLTGTGLMVRSFERLHRMSLGFEPVGRVEVMISFPRDYAPKPEARLDLFERLQQRLATLPGVRQVAIGEDSLLIGAFAGRRRCACRTARTSPSSEVLSAPTI